MTRIFNGRHSALLTLTICAFLLVFALIPSYAHAEENSTTSAINEYAHTFETCLPQTECSF